MFPATIDATVRTRADAGVDADNVTVSSWSTTSGKGIYLVVTSTEPNRPGDLERIVVLADFGVPADFPTVKGDDEIVVAGHTWEVLGEPTDYAMGPWNDQWVTATGATPGRVIKLRRALG